MILSDNETKVDMLNNRAIAKTVVELIKESQDRPISIGIHGDWGAGKSSVLEMVEDEFNGNPDIECIKFNGWKHQGFEDAKMALMSAIVSELIEKRKLGTVCANTVKRIWKNINWLNVAKGAGSIALTATTGIPPIGLLSNILENLQSSFSDTEKVDIAIESVGQYLKDAKVFEDTSITKEFAEFQASFSDLIEESKIKKLVVLIDDLDRCLPEVTIETLEAVRLFMFSNSTAFVIAADESMIEYAVKKHFPDVMDLSDNNIGQEFSKRYLEKLIQVPFRIPTLGEVEAEMYITLLMIGSKLTEGDKDFEKLLNVSIEKMKKPWKNQGLTIEDLYDVLETRYNEVRNEVMVANQIAPILASNTDGNPRKIKRFINMLLLRYKIAEARGFGDEIDLSILAKLMLAENYLGDFYKEVAAETGENGKCGILEELEKYLINISTESPLDVDETIDNKEERVDVQENSMSKKCKVWKESSEICNWVKSEPYVGNVDLRPYYFASKEKEDYFFKQIKSEKIRSIIDGLMSKSMYIASISDQIETLTVEESKYVFDILSQKIVGQGNVSNKPKGIDGIIELVKSHKELQSSLIRLIESFKIDEVGIWMCSGWDKCIIDKEYKEGLERYYKLLSEKGSPLVKATLKTVRK